MSKRPDFITVDDITRWSNNIENDPKVPQSVLNSEVMREVCYAGLFLFEVLEQNFNFSDEVIIQIQYTFGKMAFGRDPWEVCLYLIEQINKEKLEFEAEPEFLN